MYQSDRGSYRKKESVGSMFYHSCMGKLVILLLVMIVLLVIAHFTRPSEQTMREEMVDNIRQCIEARDSIKTDAIDDVVANVGYIFTHADTVVDKELLNTFNKYNRLEYYRHTFFSTMHVYNNFRPEGVRCGVGIFGMVIPTVNFNDFLLRVGPIRKDYNQQILQDVGDSEYFGENPDLGGVFREDNY